VNTTGIHRVLLLFWGLWYAIVALTNLGDALLALGVVSPDWKFASGNYGLIQQVVGRYPTPEWLTMPLFAAVILWEGLAAALFLRACLAWRAGAVEANARGGARLAYAVGIGLFATFLLVDEFFIAYQMEGSHLRILVAHVVCLLLLEKT
jgi:hypothetical protein